MTIFSNSSKQSIAIVGGGFSGVAVAANLVEKATGSMKIFIIEKTASIGPGIAFGTSQSVHPLNVPVENMGLFAEEPDGFYEWLKDNESLWRTVDPSFTQLKVSLRQYLPRKLYGIYLKDVFVKTIEKASLKGIELEVIHDEVVDIEEGFTLKTLQKRSIHADAVVLAISVPTNKSFSFETQQLLTNPRYIRNLWEMKGSIPISSEVAILGSGLTTVDTLWSLKAMGFAGKVHAISRSGKFPQSHAAFESGTLKEYHLQQLPTKSVSLLRFFRQEMRKIQDSGMDWRHLIEALRPSTTHLWMQLEVASKKQFLRHLFPLWSRHRHRMSPESGVLIAKWIVEKRLKIHRGRILAVSQKNDEKLQVEFAAEGTQSPSHVSVDYVINCTGPEYAFIRRKDPLVHALAKRGFIAPDDLGLGLKTEQAEVLSGNNGGKMFALGSLLFGERFETTSVPDIRMQAASIARVLVKSN